MIAPPVGALFTYRGRSYRVTAWLKPMPPPVEPPASERSFMRDLIDDLLYDAQQEVGPDRCKVVFCTQDKAVYVSGAGVAGCLARIEDIEVTGLVSWPQEHLDEATDYANRLAGTPVR